MTSSGRSREEEETARQIRKRLDEVVGTRFDARRDAAKWIAAAVLAVLAACLVVYTLESHRLPSEEALKAAKSRKPVEVTIVPAR